MPTGDIWIEQYVANIVNDDEKAEAIDLLKKANPDIAKDIKSVEFKITGIDPNKVASYTVTYTDDSKTGEIQAPGLTVNKVTETSRSPEIDSITIVDNVVKGKLAGPGPFKDIKVQLIINVKKEKSGDFCTDKGCIVDKDSSKSVDVNLQDDGTFSYTLQAGESLELDQIVGVTVKEPHKFVSCSTTTVKPVTPEKTEVKDPGKLTAKDKEAIDAAIRKAYTVDGISKLPNGTGDWKGVPAVIQFDDSGNVKIFRGNDVAGTWDPNNDYKFVPEKNEDGSYKLKDGAKPTITIPAKDLVKNIKPDAPAVALSKDKKNITITPNLEIDTDATKIEVTYTGKDGNEKTEIFKKEDGENGKWKVPEGSELKVDENTGVVTIPVEKIKNKSKVTANVTDVGGIADDDKDAKTSEDGSKEIRIPPMKPEIAVDGTTGDVTITPVDKDKDKIAKRMNITYTPKGETETKTVTASRDDEGKWTVPEDSGFKVSDDGKTITIPNELIKHETDIIAKTNDGDDSDLLESDEAKTEIVKDMTKPNPPEVKLDEENSNITITPPQDKDTISVTVTYKDKDGNTKTPKTTKDNQGKWTIENNDNGETVDESTGVITIPKGNYKTEQPVKAFGNDEAENKSKENEATPVEVTFDKNGGNKDIEGSILLKGGNFVLPEIFDKQFFPKNKEFAGWQVGKETKKPGDKITVNENTVVKALWKAKAQPGKDTDNKEERPIFFYFKLTTKPVLNLKDHSQYMIGYKDGTFRPNNKMSRQEVTVMLSRLLSERPQKGMIYSRDYKDVADDLWSVTAISYMSNLKMVKGYPDGNFRPYANITRAEFAAMVVRFENISAVGSKTFTDLQKDHWAYEVIQKAAQAGWISGYPDGSFKPDQPITRGEVVTITNRMLNRFADEDYVDHNLNKIINYTDIDKSHWAYYPVVEATNGHNYERKGNGKDETWFEVTGSTFVYDK